MLQAQYATKLPEMLSAESTEMDHGHVGLYAVCASRSRLRAAMPRAAPHCALSHGLQALHALGLCHLREGLDVLSRSTLHSS